MAFSENIKKLSRRIGYIVNRKIPNHSNSVFENLSTRSIIAQVAHELSAGVVVATQDYRALDVFDTPYQMEDGVIRKETTVTPQSFKNGSRFH